MVPKQMIPHICTELLLLIICPYAHSRPTNGVYTFSITSHNNNPEQPNMRSPFGQAAYDTYPLFVQAAKLSHGMIAMGEFWKLHHASEISAMVLRIHRSPLGITQKPYTAPCPHTWRGLLCKTHPCTSCQLLGQKQKSLWQRKRKH